MSSGSSYEDFGEDSQPPFGAQADIPENVHRLPVLSSYCQLPEPEKSEEETYLMYDTRRIPDCQVYFF